MKYLVCLLFVGVGIQLSLPSTRAATVFTEAGGVVVVEAEGFSNNIARSINGTNFQWVATNSVPGASGGTYMEATPNMGVNQTNSWLGVSPQLDYSVSFANALTHYVWIRGYAASNTDDSVHAGLLGAGVPGATNTASGITLNQYGNWQWTRTNTLGGVATLTVSATTTQTFSLWMREDGMRVDRILLTTNNNFQTTLGNCFHIPSDVEPDIGLPMRNPTDNITSNTSVLIYEGNQFQGAGGNPGNQLTTGSTIFYRNATNLNWTSLAMGFETR